MNAAAVHIENYVQSVKLVLMYHYSYPQFKKYEAAFSYCLHRVFSVKSLSLALLVSNCARGLASRLT